MVGPDRYDALEAWANPDAIGTTSIIRLLLLLTNHKVNHVAPLTNDAGMKELVTKAKSQAESHLRAALGKNLDMAKAAYKASLSEECDDANVSRERPSPTATCPPAAGTSLEVFAC